VLILQFDGLSKRAVRLEKVGQLFDLPPLDFSVVQDTSKELATHRGKWDLLSNMREITAQWMTSKVSPCQFVGLLMI
jgi:hypothetical protein